VTHTVWFCVYKLIEKMQCCFVSHWWCHFCLVSDSSNERCVGWQPVKRGRILSHWHQNCCLPIVLHFCWILLWRSLTSVSVSCDTSIGSVAKGGGAAARSSKYRGRQLSAKYRGRQLSDYSMELQLKFWKQKGTPWLKPSKKLWLSNK